MGGQRINPNDRAAAGDAAAYRAFNGRGVRLGGM